MHIVCAQENVEYSDLEHMYELKCGVCKKTGHGILAEASALVSQKEIPEEIAETILEDEGTQVPGAAAAGAQTPEAKAKPKAKPQKLKRLKKLDSCSSKEAAAEAGAAPEAAAAPDIAKTNKPETEDPAAEDHEEEDTEVAPPKICGSKDQATPKRMPKAKQAAAEAGAAPEAVAAAEMDPTAEDQEEENTEVADPKMCGSKPKHQAKPKQQPKAKRQRIDRQAAASAKACEAPEEPEPEDPAAAASQQGRDSKLKAKAGSLAREPAKAKDPSGPSMTDFPFNDRPETFWCCFCHNECHVAKARRVMSKTKGEIRCDVCDSKCTTLWRGFGTWPTEEFKVLPKEAQIQFYNDIKHKSGVRDVCAIAIDAIESYEDKKETFAVNGEFRPLAFWSLHGYDAERIEREAKAQDTTETRLAGKCYRVPVQCDRKERSTGMIRRGGWRSKTPKRNVQDGFGEWTPSQLAELAGQTPARTSAPASATSGSASSGGISTADVASVWDLSSTEDNIGDRTPLSSTEESDTTSSVSSSSSKPRKKKKSRHRRRPRRQ